MSKSALQQILYPRRRDDESPERDSGPSWQHGGALAPCRNATAALEDKPGCYPKGAQMLTRYEDVIKERQLAVARIAMLAVMPSLTVDDLAEIMKVEREYHNV